ncbi:AvrD family protein [Acinetobacter pittii]|uniref:AvrD family protein n=1 Tax=Acinetobacter pittii TaxID=48296 RepID=UPI000A35DAFF|nr:AvrD family protein [Acinetobacter pittii]MCZ1179792.1 AvrD family protein [Acinetobacter pittii]OTU23644.1 hypothetical protein CAT62_01345 [Acinetobacter pittii]OTU48447.1 hypothetical protein CAT36_18885 [Acinetobacter pittii]QDB83677.1 hypothetical protein APMS7_15560 [Acinetobacter pittii]QRF09871.1 hypothetical protein HRJ47_18705 [Acinetobacter pittii]
MNLSFFKEVDEFLGDKNTRYFGAGYINSSHDIYNFQYESDDIETNKFSCLGKVVLPQTWSIKNNGSQKPHLSTIDIIELALLTFDQLIQAIHNRTICYKKLIHKMVIRAGKSPIESEFDKIVISGSVSKEDRDNNVMNLNISNMSIEILYKNDVSKIEPSEFEEYLKTPLEINDVMINVDELKASALVNNKRILNENVEPWSTSCLFSVGLQLGQILLYQLDSISRAESNTLWMKKTEIHFLSDRPNMDASHPIFTRLDNVRRYKAGDHDWRKADIYSILGNTKIICSVTHQLPHIS